MALFMVLFIERVVGFFDLISQTVMCTFFIRITICAVGFIDLSDFMVLKSHSLKRGKGLFVYT